MKESNIVKALVATIAVFAISAPAIVSAGAESKLKDRSVKVSYANLNLRDEAGAQALYRRLQRASKRVCGVEKENTASYLASSKARHCYREKLTAAVEKIDNVELTKIHES